MTMIQVTHVQRRVLMNLGIAPQSTGFFRSEKVKVDNTELIEMREDLRVLKTLDKIKKELELVHHHFEHATDETLIDVYIYEMKALNLKFKYYHEMCKERGLVR